MITPQEGNVYVIDFHEGESYTHFHGEAICTSSNPVDIDGVCYTFKINNKIVYFPVESIIYEKGKTRKK